MVPPHSSISPVMRAAPADGSAPSASTPKPATRDDAPGEWLAYGPPAPTLDEADRKQQIRTLLDRGMAEVRAGVGISLDAARQRTDAQIASRRK